MMMIKYKVSEVARDFDLPGKEIVSILADHGISVKSTAQALSEAELDVIMDHLTQSHQISSLSQVFAPAAEAAEKRRQQNEDRILKQQKESEAAIRAAENARDAAAIVSNQQPQALRQQPQAFRQQPQAPRQQPQAFRQQPQAPRQQPQAPKKQAAKRPQQTTLTPAASPSSANMQTAPSAEELPNTKAPKITYVDTRGVSVNPEKYDERLDTLVPEKVDKMAQTAKQKIIRQNQKRPAFASNKRRAEEQEKMRRLKQQTMIKKTPLKVLIPDEINVGELALRLKKSAADVIKQLMKLGVMASVSQAIDFDTASLVALELGAVVEKEVIVTIEERLLDDSADKEELLVPRAPVVVVMGHVDHGKTSLLDVIRQTNVVSGEAGGITQHIGAYRVHINDRDITFLDTPGHAAFTSMRARGAMVTDIAILVVAADDGIMPQTVEAINHARAASVPIIVAINKMDKPSANPDRIKQQLTEYELVSEEWGGSTIICPVSALKKTGIENLLEMVLLTADMMDLRANPSRAAKGTVIEAKLDKSKGPAATILVQNGTLHAGDIVIAGTAVGRIRAMTDDLGRKIDEAGPSVPVEIIGLADVPGAGDLFYAVEDERMARTLAEQRREEEKQERTSNVHKVTLETLFDSINTGAVKALNIIVKADVQGSAEAIKTSLEKLTNDEVRIRVIHSGVGGINDSDVMLASASGAIIVGFNVRPEPVARESAIQSHVDIRLYRIIYDCIEEIEQAMKGMLTPRYQEVILGHAEIRQTFKVTGVGTIAGCYVLDGKMQRSEKVRIVRDHIVVHEGDLATLRRFKDDVKEVAAGYECGMSFEKYNDIKEGDIVEAYIMEELKR